MMARARGMRTAPRAHATQACGPGRRHRGAPGGHRVLTGQIMVALWLQLMFAAVRSSSILFAAASDSHKQQLLGLDPALVRWQSPNTAPALGPVAKSAKNPLITEDQPWDGAWLNSNPSIVYRAGIFQLWWTAKLVCPGATPPNCTRRPDAVPHHHTCCHPGYNFSVPASAEPSGGLLYAHSTDGVTWERPRLGLNSVLGSTQNNVVFKVPGRSASQVGSPGC